MLRLSGSQAAHFAQSSHGEARADARGCLQTPTKPTAPLLLGETFGSFPHLNLLAEDGDSAALRGPAPIRHNSLTMAPEPGAGGSEQGGTASRHRPSPSPRRAETRGRAKALGSLCNPHLAAVFSAPRINQLRTAYSHCWNRRAGTHLLFTPAPPAFIPSLIHL